MQAIQRRRRPNSRATLLACTITEKEKELLAKIGGEKRTLIVSKALSDALQVLGERHDFEEWQETVSTLLINLAAATAEVSAPLATMSRPEIVVTEKWSRQLDEFAFFTGLRLSEALALRWDAVDLEKRQVHVCRTVALGEVEERTKTGKDQFMQLRSRALHALEFARQYAERSKKWVGKIKKFPYVFPPPRNSEYVKQTSDRHKQWGRRWRG